MRVQDILVSKGRKLVTVSPESSVDAAMKLLASEQIGALLVVDGERELVGVLSERDVVTAIAQRGAMVLASSVGEVMSDAWLVATPEHSVLELMRVMTEERVRHIPVASGVELIGIISVGDILKSRLAEKGQAIEVLRDVARLSLVAA